MIRGHIEKNTEVPKIDIEDKTIEKTVEISEQQEKLLKEYADQLAFYSSGKVRLTGAKDPEILWKEHITDCLYSAQVLPDSGSVVDIGTGGGLPGLVWAVCRPDLQFVLVDSLAKKTKALQDIVNHLELENIEVLCERSEELAEQRRETFTAASARAVSHSGIIAEYLAPLVKVGGTLLAMKGPAYKEELHDVRNRWDQLGLEEPSVYKYRLFEKKSYILIWNKIYGSPEIYPRRPGRAEKKPWWERKR